MKKIGSSEKIASNPGALVCLSLCMLSASLGTSVANIALPALAQAFDVPFLQVRWVVVSYLASLTLSAVFAGRLGDFLGRQRMLLAGLVLFLLASIFCGLAPDVWLLISARAGQGMGAAVLMTMTIALVHETTGGARVGRAMGLLGTMSAVGTALGPTLGGLMIGLFDWRSVFLVLVPIALVAVGLVLCTLPVGKPAAKSPLINLLVVPSAGIAPSVIASLLIAAVMMATLIVGPFYLGLALGLSEAMVGVVMSIGPVISIFCGVPSGRLVDVWGAMPVLTIGLVAMSIGAFALSVLPEVFGVGGYIAAIAILTPGYQMFQSANNTNVMAGVQTDQRGSVSGLLTLARNLGLILGATAMGAVFSFGIGTAEIIDASADSITDGMQLTFVVAGALLVAALWIVRRKPNNPDLSL